MRNPNFNIDTNSPLDMQLFNLAIQFSLQMKSASSTKNRVNIAKSFTLALVEFSDNLQNSPQAKNVDDITSAFRNLALKANAIPKPTPNEQNSQDYTIELSMQSEEESKGQDINPAVLRIGPDGDFILPLENFVENFVQKSIKMQNGRPTPTMRVTPSKFKGTGSRFHNAEQPHTNASKELNQNTAALNQNNPELNPNIPMLTPNPTVGFSYSIRNMNERRQLIEYQLNENYRWQRVHHQRKRQREEEYDAPTPPSKKNNLSM